LELAGLGQPFDGFIGESHGRQPPRVALGFCLKGYNAAQWRSVWRQSMTEGKGYTLDHVTVGFVESFVFGRVGGEDPLNSTTLFKGDSEGAP
jgi:hypothetical protein